MIFYATVEATIIKQSIHRHQTPSWYRNAASRASPYGPLRPNVTPSKNRKHITYRNAARGGLSHGHRKSAHKIFVKIGPAVPEICSRTDRYIDRQTLRQTQTDKPIAIFRSPIGAE